MKKLFILLVSLPLLSYAQADWQVSPTDFEYSMTVTGVVSMGEITYDHTQGLRVAAFNAENICVGVAENQYFSKVEKYRVPLMIYSNENGKAVSLKVYISEEDTVYTLGKGYVFYSNERYGTYAAPEIWTLDYNTGFGDIIESQLKVYPNPAHHVFYIDGVAFSAVEVYNQTGQKMNVKIQQQDGRIAVDISALQVGFYLISVDDGIQRSVEKLIVR